MMNGDRPKVLTLFREYFFTIAVFFCIILAEIFPWLGARGGPLKPEITGKYLAVFVIFYTSSLNIRWSDLCHVMKHFKLHILIQGFSFVFIPVFVQVFLFLFSYLADLNSWIHKGLIIVGCMPPPVSSSVILTKSVGGNEAAAIFNTALGSILGTILTPTLLFLYVGISSTLPIVRTLLQLIQTVILPVVLAQLSKKIFNKSLVSSFPWSVFGQTALLFIIYASFCDIFIQDDYNIDASAILITVLLVILIQAVLMYTIFKVSCYDQNLFTAQDIIAITFCGTHKSLTLGLPLLRTLYSGYSHLSQITLPLLIYHPVQLILGGFMVPYGQRCLFKPPL